MIEFTDWTTPNVALAAGDLDINYFQHQAFLDNAVKERGYKFRSVALGVLPNIGLYSTHIKRFGDLKDGARVGVANDPVNQGRGLLLLQKAGLIKLRDGVGAKGSVNDIVENPKKLKFVEVEGRSSCARSMTWTSRRAIRRTSSMPASRRWRAPDCSTRASTTPTSLSAS